MKNKRRHELQTNQLADWLGKKLEAVRPHLNLILLTATLVVLLILTVVVMRGNSKARRAASWGKYAVATSRPQPIAKELEAVSEGPAQPWAQAAVADLRLEEGSRLLLQGNDRETALETLRAARQTYESVLENAGDLPMLQRRVRFALGKTLESMGELEEASEQYDKLAKGAKDTAIGKAAAERLAAIKDPKIIEFYEQFAEYTPPSLGGGDSGTSSTPLSLPLRPDFSFPEASSDPMGETGDGKQPTSGGGDFSLDGDKSRGSKAGTTPESSSGDKGTTDSTDNVPSPPPITPPSTEGGTGDGKDSTSGDKKSNE